MTIQILLRYIIFGIFLYLFFLIIARFIPSIVLAAAVAVIFYPFDQLLEKKMGIGSTAAAALSFLLAMLIIFGPVLILLGLITREALLFAHTFDPDQARELAQTFQTINIGGYEFDLASYQEQLVAFVKKAGESASQIAAAVGANFGIFLLRFIAFALMLFYFLRDGDEIIAKLRQLVPFSRGQNDTLFQKFIGVSGTVLKGTVLSAVLSGVIAFFGFWLFGVRAPLIWALLAALLSLIPTIGPLFIYAIGAIIIGVLSGWGIALGFVGYFITLELILLQNVIKPKFLDEKLSLHPILVFFALVGGIEAFGSIGIIYGPVIAILFVTLVDFIAADYKKNTKSTA